MTPRTEYGARVVCPSAVVYVKDFSRPVVVAWMAEYGTVAALALVSRVWTGDVCSGWEAAA